MSHNTNFHWVTNTQCPKTITCNHCPNISWTVRPRDTTQGPHPSFLSDVTTLRGREETHANSYLKAKHLREKGFLVESGS